MQVAALPSGPARAARAAAARRKADARRLGLRRTRIRLVRLGLMAGSALAIAVFAGAAFLQRGQDLGVDAKSLVQGDQMVIDAPRFVGRTAGRTRFTLTAKRATRQIGDDAAPLSLDGPTLELSDGGKVTADKGVWRQGRGDDRTAQRLQLSGNVTIRRADGDTGRARQAVWTPEPDMLALSGGVSLDRPSGERATAQVAEWRTADQSLALDGGVRVEFKDGVATSTAARFEAGGGRLIGTGQATIRTSLGIVSGDRYVYDTRTRRLQLAGRARATLDGRGASSQR
jgi:hypothetical protein